jgi:putative ABC transport system permease protein
MKFLALIVRNMRRQARRTLLTILTIAVATLVFAMLVAVPSSMDRMIASAAAGQRLFVTNRAGPYNVPPKDCIEIRKMEHVTGCAANWDIFMRYRSDSDWIGMVASDIDILDMSPEMPSTPRDVAFFRKEKRAAAVGVETMKRYGWHVGQQIVLRGPFNGTELHIPFIIAGVITGDRYPNLFLIRRDYVTDAANAAVPGKWDSYANRLVVRVDTAENVGQVARVIDETFHNSESETRTQTESDFLANGLANIGNIRAIIFSLVAVVLVTVLLIAGNSMAMTVRDRTSEVALLRTLGFGSGRIAYLLFGEAILLGLVGGVIGVGGALALFAGGIDMGTITRGLGLISVSPTVATLSLAAAVAVTVVSGTMPVAGALRIPAAIALRRVV